MFAQTSQSCSDSTSSSSMGEITMEFSSLLEAVDTSMKSFENCTFLFHENAAPEAAQVISTLIVNIASKISTFNALPMDQQLTLSQKSAPAFVLVLTLATKVSNFIHCIRNDQTLVKLFPMFQLQNKAKLMAMKTIFDSWKPSMKEITCLLAMILSKTRLNNADQRYAKFVGQVMAITTRTINPNRIELLHKVVDAFTESF